MESLIALSMTDFALAMAIAIGVCRGMKIHIGKHITPVQLRCLDLLVCIWVTLGFVLETNYIIRVINTFMFIYLCGNSIYDVLKQAGGVISAKEENNSSTDSGSEGSSTN